MRPLLLILYPTTVPIILQVMLFSMAIWTKQLQIFKHIVLPVSVFMVHVKDLVLFISAPLAYRASYFKQPEL